ncbi:MAG TPA: cupin domain-containing protein [Egicoccus sp.]|nr:cupin domain-containing protein [Egicoccus sp.]HSK24875.1 cupin domain-containing protein [Egicoccus sp.]
MLQVIRSEERPVRVSQRDGRRRVDVVTEEMLGTRAVQVDIVYNDPGVIGSPHMHANADHVFMVIGGHGIMHTDDASVEIFPGDVVFIPRGDYHWFHNTSDVVSERIEMWIPAPDGTVWRDPDDTCNFQPAAAPTPTT